MRFRLSTGLLLALAVAALIGVGTAAVVTGTALEEPETNERALAQEQPEPDNTISRIDLAADGSATWTVTFRTRLATDDERDEYERFRASFREDPDQYLDPYQERMVGVVDRANETHTREMRAMNFTAKTAIQEVPRRWGIVTFQFRWEGFAATEDDRVVVGDIFDGGFYIGENDVLEVSAPDGYAVIESDPTPDEVSDGVVEWHGREDFDDGRPRIVASSSEASTTMANRDVLGDRLEGTLIAAGLITAVLFGSGLYGLNTGRLTLPVDRATDDDTPATERNAETDVEPDHPADTQLLTDEDRVRRLLQEADGRIKQSAVVEELEWSKSKTSRVLSKMADDGTVEKLRIGRENVIELTDDE